MNRDTAVRTWREVCGNDTVMAMGVVTGRMLEEFAARIEAAERERCAVVCETIGKDIVCPEECASAIRGPNAAVTGLRQEMPR